MDKTKSFILDGLSYYALADLPGWPYDCAFELLSAPPSRKRLIMLGFNGSSADASMTNSQSLIQDYTYPFVSGIQQGMAGKWGAHIWQKDCMKYPLSSVIAGRMSYILMH